MESNEINPSLSVLLANTSYVDGGLGKVYEDEKLCCDGKFCCKKRKCCKAFVIVLVIIDFLEVILVSFIVIFFVSLDEYVQNGGDERVLRRYIARIFLGFWAQGITFIIKVCRGIQWLCKQNRDSYIKYYRMNMTFSLSFILYLIGMFGM